MENNNSDNEMTILIVDDDAVLLKMYSQQLSASGYKVLNAMDGDEGLRVVNAEKVDLIISDIMLPRLSGTEFIEKLSKDKKLKNIPVIAWSNLPDETEKEKVLKFGAKEYIVKNSLSLDSLVEIVKKYL